MPDGSEIRRAHPQGASEQIGTPRSEFQVLLNHMDKHFHWIMALQIAILVGSIGLLTLVLLKR